MKNFFKVISLIIFLASSFFPIEAEAKRLFHEKMYQEIWCAKEKGFTEVRMTDRTRVDCLTDDFAIEFDFADKWAESLGQSLHYARMTNKMPGIVLIVEESKYMRFVDRLTAVLDTYLIKVRVWVITPELFREELGFE